MLSAAFTRAYHYADLNERSLTKVTRTPFPKISVVQWFYNSNLYREILTFLFSLVCQIFHLQFVFLNSVWPPNWVNFFVKIELILIPINWSLCFWFAYNHYYNNNYYHLFRMNKLLWSHQIYGNRTNIFILTYVKVASQLSSRKWTKFG